MFSDFLLSRAMFKWKISLQEAEELRRLKDLNNVKFSQGKKAYSIGQYMASMLLFKEALQKEGEYSALGGEIQLWLALAYQVRSCQMDRQSSKANCNHTRTAQNLYQLHRANLQVEETLSLPLRSLHSVVFKWLLAGISFYL